MKLLFVSCFIAALSSLDVFGQAITGEVNSPKSNVILQQGQLVSLRLVIGQPIRIFVVGREEAKLNLSQMSLSVRRLKPYPAKVLSLDRFDNYFVISEPVDLKTTTDIEVITKIKNRSETLRFKIEGPRP